MNINDLLKGFSCSCGKHHSCEIRYVYVESGAIARLSSICENVSRVLIVADENTDQAAGRATRLALSQQEINTVLFSGKKLLVPNEAAVRTVTERLGEAQMIVGIGSGVIQDLCKYVSFRTGIPYVIVATAPSMDGYASNGAAMITDGMKVTYSAGLPYAILGDVDVLKQAPMEMLQAGYGDIVGKFSALNDWKLSHHILGEYFCPYLYDLTYQQVQATLSLAEGIQKRDEESIRTLMEALVVIGIMMSFAGSSRPASGSEHHLSHFFEIVGLVKQKEYFPHGIDVAYSTVITARLREDLLALPFRCSTYRISEDRYRREMKRVYGSVAEGCMALQSKAGHYQADRARLYKEKEDPIKAVLSEVPTAAEIERMLSLVGLQMDRFYSLYGKDYITDAVWYAKDLKDRYTVLWLYYDLLGGKNHAE